MFLTFALCTCAVLIAHLLWHKPANKKGNKLPGPTPLPLLGNLLQIGFRPHLTFTKWAKRYGPIYGIKLGLEDAIIVNDYKIIKELFSEPASTGRMGDNPVMMEFTKGPYGVMNSSGSTWDAQRKFTVRTLRNLGFAKSSMETLILDEVQTMLDWFKKKNGRPISGVRIFNAPVINSLWRLVTGERCNWEESRPPIIDAMDEFYKYVAPGLLGWNRYVASVDAMIKLLHQTITKHKETFDSNELRDYIDHHLVEIGNETDPKSSFYKDDGKANMVAGVFDLFFAGSETSALSLSWTLLFLKEHPETQRHLQKEIDTIVGSRLPSLADRINMPFSEAVIAEILRISTVAPCGIMHKMKSELSFHGYHLRKGANVVPNLYAVHHDPEVWRDPENFRPERFLSEEGTKFVQNEALIPFSEGKRKCIGEMFARDTLFLFVTCICQQFDILPVPDSTEKSDFAADFGLLLGPKPFNVVVSSRNC